MSDSINSSTFDLIEKHASGDLEMESEREDKNPDKGDKVKYNTVVFKGLFTERFEVIAKSFNPSYNNKDKKTAYSF